MEHVTQIFRKICVEKCTIRRLTYQELCEIKIYMYRIKRVLGSCDRAS